MTKAELTSLINGGNIRRYSNYASAERAAAAQRYYAPVLLGCDGRYWVPSSTRLASRLVKAGYESATV